MIDVLTEPLFEAVQSRVLDLLPQGMVATFAVIGMILWLLVREQELRNSVTGLERQERELLRADAAGDRADEEVGEIAQRFHQLAMECESNPGRAERVAIMLGHVCRSMTRLSVSSLSSVREETELIRDRILFEVERNGHPLEVRIEISPGLEVVRIDRSFLAGATGEIIENVFRSSARTLVLRITGESSFISFVALAHPGDHARRVLHRSVPTAIEEDTDRTAPSWQGRGRLLAVIALGLAAVRMLGSEVGFWLVTIGRPAAIGMPIPVSSDLWLTVTTVTVAILLVGLELRAGTLEARTLVIGEKLRQAERRRLETQLQPHFLLNAINAIANLITVDPAKAAETCRRLESFLQHVRRSRCDGLISLAEELANLDSYLAVEHVRFGERLRISCAVSAEARVARVPSLLLQPLFENAIRHGVARLAKGGEIQLQAMLRDGALEIVVENESRPARTNGGVGLSNTAERLRLTCGERAWLQTSLRSGRFRVEISAPQTPDSRVTRPVEPLAGPALSDLPVLLCHTRARGLVRPPGPISGVG